MNNKNPSKAFRELLKQKKPLQIVGCINAYCAVMAEKVGHKSIYLSERLLTNKILFLLIMVKNFYNFLLTFQYKFCFQNFY